MSPCSATTVAKGDDLFGADDGIDGGSGGGGLFGKDDDDLFGASAKKKTPKVTKKKAAAKKSEESDGGLFGEEPDLTRCVIAWFFNSGDSFPVASPSNVRLQ